EVFRELSERFADFVGVLDEFADSSSLRGDKDMLRQYEHLLNTNDSRFADKVVDKNVSAVNVRDQRIH
ncbi:MAG: hypothetical protein P8Y12_00935, partial [Gammaproteobacteria bacterium]